MNSKSKVTAYTSQGPIKGQANQVDGVLFYSFVNIPYAHIPEGQLRFAPPTEITPCDFCKVRKKAIGLGVGGDNVLLLQIYTPEVTPKLTESGYKKKSNRPVIAFVPGEYMDFKGNVLAQYLSTYFKPQFLINHDVVVVLISYRLGILSQVEFDDPSINAPGNISLYDIKMAFKWIRKEIENFGGCSENVTAFGQSNGAINLYNLMMKRKMFEKCFDKAILSSCARDRFKDYYFKRSNYSIGQEITRSFTDNIAFSEKKSAQYLQEMSNEFIREMEEAVLREYLLRMPSREELENILENTHTFSEKIPVIIGYNSCESLFDAESFLDKNSKDSVLKQLEEKIKITEPEKKRIINKTIKENFLSNKNITSVHSKRFLRITTDLTYLIRIMAIVTSLAKKTTVYLYRCNYNFDTAKIKFGSGHGSELRAIFNLGASNSSGKEGSEYDFTSTLTAIWAQFAKTGDPNVQSPNTPLLPNWKPITNQLSHCLEFSNNGINYCEIPEKRRMVFWEKKYNVNFFSEPL